MHGYGLSMFVTVSQCVFILIVIVPIIYFLWQYYFKLARREALVWAKMHNHEILSLKRSRWDLGPFQGKIVRGQEVFEITIRDNNNESRQGWIRVSVPFLMGAYLFKALGESRWLVVWSDEI
jgi:hypothetical protein